MGESSLAHETIVLFFDMLGNIISNDLRNYDTKVGKQAILEDKRHQEYQSNKHS